MPPHVIDVALEAQRGSITCPNPHCESAPQPGSNLRGPLGSLWHNWSSLFPLGDKVQAPSSGNNTGGVGVAQLAWDRREMRVEHKPGGRLRVKVFSGVLEETLDKPSSSSVHLKFLAMKWE